MFENFTRYDDCEPAGLELPKIQLDKFNNSEEFLVDLINKGLKNRGLEGRPEYEARIKYELDTIRELGFIDYFLLNWEVLDFAHKNDFPIGDGRGSAAGSLILYLINIVNKDPVANELYFERFISKNRARQITDKHGKIFLDGSLAPDVDTDVAHAYRPAIIDFIEKKYAGRTSQILTFNTLSSRLCIKEAFKFFGFASEEEANRVSSMIPEKHGVVVSLEKSIEESEKFKAWTEEFPEVFKYAKKIENLNKNTGVHPSGIAICSQDIRNVIPLQLTNDGNLISGYDMNDVADLMVKFDILGLRTLSIAHATCKKIGINFDDIDDSDPFIYKQLQDFNHPAGLFQISASTNFRVTQDVKPDNLQELSDVVALARPQSLQFVTEYVRQKENFVPLGIHDELDKILAESKNVMLYQEQLMQAANRVFGMSLDDAETLRRIVGKKKVKEIPAWKSKIFDAAKNQGIGEEVAQYFWEVVEAAASYGFNKSHSVCYASLAAKTVYLKYKYPQHFFCSILQFADDSPDPLNVISQVSHEIKDFGINLLPPRLDKSDLDFTIEGKNLRYGLKSIKGVAEKARKAIHSFSALEDANKYDVFLKAKELKINIGILTALIYAGALGSDNRLLIALEAQTWNLLTDREKRNFYLLGEEYDYNLLQSIIDVKNSQRLADDNRPIMKESRFATFHKKFVDYKTLYQENISRENLALWWFEMSLLGYAYSRKVSDCFTSIGNLYPLKTMHEQKKWRVVGKVTDVLVRISKNNNRYMRLTIVDEDFERVLIFCDSPREDKLSDFLEDNEIKKQDIVIVTGSTSSTGSLFIDSIDRSDVKVYTKIRQLK